MTARTTLLACGLSAILAVPAWADPRFTAELGDGTIVTGDDVAFWHDAASQPFLGQTPLFNPANPVRWLRDDSLPFPRAPEASVEFWLGDQLPGRVTAFEAGDATSYEAVPPHLVIEPETAVGSRAPAFSGPVRILPRWVRRIVWQRRASDSFRPGTLFYRDGRTIAFESLTWDETAVRLMTMESIVEAPFAQIAELHLPRVDPWDLYYEQVAAQIPAIESGVEHPGMVPRLLRMRCDDGLIATGSTARFAARSSGNIADPENWVHVVQPVWSLDPLHLRHRCVRLRHYWLPHEVPLSTIDIARGVRRATLAGAWSWWLDRNVQGGPLRSAIDEAGWGIGVQADCRLEIDLPAFAQRFQTRVALNALAGRGGCACPSVVLAGTSDLDGTGEQILFNGPYLVGSGTLIDSGPLEIPVARGGARRLALVADSAHEGRPLGADPFDIRDTVDWLQPRLDLDRDSLHRESRSRVPRLVHAWHGWQADDHGGGLATRASWDESGGGSSAAFRMHIEPQQPFFRLARRLRVPSDRPYLLVSASSLALDVSAPRLQVQVDGDPVALLDVPPRPPRGDPDPLVVSLEPFQGSRVTIEIIQLPSGERDRIDWRGLSFVERHPGTLPIFQDEPAFADTLDAGPGSASILADDAFVGLHAVRVTAAERRATRLTGLPVSIREYPRLGEFRYIRFAWRKSGGERISLGVGHDGRFGPDSPTESQARRSFRYDAGFGGASFGLAMRLDKRLPDGWSVVTRDLHADFGEFDLSGLSLGCPDGDFALFDQIVLARTLADLDRFDQTVASHVGMR